MKEHKDPYLDWFRLQGNQLLRIASTQGICDFADDT